MKRTPYTGAKIITADKAEELIRKHKGKIFWVAFTRKTNKKKRNPETGEMVFVARKGDIRYMSCRTGVKAGVKGVGRNFDPKEKRLISVYDIQKKGYRMFSKDHLVYLKIARKKYVVLTENAREFCLKHPEHEMTKAVKANRVEL